MTDERNIADPQPGYWLVRCVKNGPRIPACIERVDLTHEPGNPDNVLDRWPPFRLVAYLAGDEVPVDRVWLTRGEPITKAEYDYQLADLRWLQKHQPSDPKANPYRPIENTKPVF